MRGHKGPLRSNFKPNFVISIQNNIILQEHIRCLLHAIVNYFLKVSLLNEMLNERVIVTFFKLLK